MDNLEIPGSVIDWYAKKNPGETGWLAVTCTPVNNKELSELRCIHRTINESLSLYACDHNPGKWSDITKCFIRVIHLNVITKGIQPFIV